MEHKVQHFLCSARLAMFLHYRTISLSKTIKDSYTYLCTPYFKTVFKIIMNNLFSQLGATESKTIWHKSYTAHNTKFEILQYLNYILLETPSYIKVNSYISNLHSLSWVAKIPYQNIIKCMFKIIIISDNILK